MKTVELDHAEIAIILWCLAHAKAEIDVLNDRFINDFKGDLEKVIRKLEREDSAAK